MGTREELHEVLCGILRSRNAYYQPPNNLKMEYDCIRYSRREPSSRFANDKRYSKLNCYELIAISRKPDPEFLEKLMDLPYCSPGRPYPADNLNHYPFTLYY